MQRAEVDEICNCIAKAVEVKNSLLVSSGGRLNFSFPDRSYLGLHLSEVMEKLSLEECRALVLHLASRTVDLRGQSGLVNEECKRLEDENAAYTRQMRQMRDFLSTLRHGHKQDLKRQARENEKKIRLIQAEKDKVLEERNLFREIYKEEGGRSKKRTSSSKDKVVLTHDKLVIKKK